MDIRPIRTDDDHRRAMAQIELLWGAPDGSSEAESLEVLVTLVDVYEAKHHPIDPPSPIEAIRFRLEQEGLTRSALVPVLGSRARVSEILNGRRALSIAMVRKLRARFGISADSLISLEKASAKRRPVKGQQRGSKRKVSNRRSKFRGASV